MTISLERLSKNTPNAIFFTLILSVTIATGIEVLLNPYSRENIPITNLGGIFFRSMFVIFAISLVWIYRYGWVDTVILLFSYYGFQEFVFTQIFFGVYGQNMFQYLNYSISWDIRIAWMVIGTFGLLFLRWYTINLKSIWTGVLFFGYFLFLLAVWPFSYFNGEGNIPLQPLPQIQEFVYNILFPIWFYFLVRVKK